MRDYTGSDVKAQAIKQPVIGILLNVKEKGKIKLMVCQLESQKAGVAMVMYHICRYLMWSLMPVGLLSMTSELTVCNGPCLLAILV